MAKGRFNFSRRKLITLAVVVVLVALAAWSVHDWHQLWKISSAPDNVPIVAMLFLVPFFTWLGVRQSKANDDLILSLEQDPLQKPDAKHRDRNATLPPGVIAIAKRV